jgi:hypothetical protein
MSGLRRISRWILITCILPVPILYKLPAVAPLIDWSAGQVCTHTMIDHIIDGCNGKSIPKKYVEI